MVVRVLRLGSACWDQHAVYVSGYKRRPRCALCLWWSIAEAGKCDAREKRGSAGWVYPAVVLVLRDFV
jgi:hypothetical protein